jgi:hypothetical protein
METFRQLKEEMRGVMSLLGNSGQSSGRGGRLQHWTAAEGIMAATNAPELLMVPDDMETEQVAEKVQLQLQLH